RALIAFWYHSVIMMCLLFWVEPVVAGCDLVRKVKLTEWRVGQGDGARPRLRALPCQTHRDTAAQRLT
ncbi:MAG: hypothetical protein ACREXR_21685, partial [Gammaproteobacteria bacterium]